MRAQTIHMAARLALVLFILGARSAVPSDREVREVDHRRVDGRVLWVAAQDAFTADGELDPHLFSARARERLDDLRRRNGDTCTYAAAAPALELHARVDSLEDLAAAAQTIVTGTVIAAENGFYRGDPGTLFTIRVAESMKRPSRASLSTVYLFVPIAEIPTSRGMICARGPLHSLMPRAGDDVLFFTHLPPLDRESRLFSVEPHLQLLVQTRDVLQVPEPLRKTWSDSDLSTAAARVRAAVQRQERRGNAR